MVRKPKTLVIGGGGYVGSELVTSLADANFDVTVLDTFWYGRNVYPPKVRANIRRVNGDMRDFELVENLMRDQEICIHLACISNDPSFEMNPELGKSINYDSFTGVLSALAKSNVKRFIYASSSSVYGVKDKPDVTENDSCEPLTDYSKFKLMCEEDLKNADLPRDLAWTIIRPATVCGYSERLRLDLIVNVLTISALTKKCITVHGGSQLRPNIHIQDMVRAYMAVLEADIQKVHGQIFNVGFENRTLREIAEMVRDVVDPNCEIQFEESKDPRSYHINSHKILSELGFKPKFGIRQAIREIKLAFERNDIVDPVNNPIYYNIRQMKKLGVAQ